MEAFLLVILLILVLVINNRFAGIRQLLQQQTDDLARLRTDFTAFRTQTGPMAAPPPAAEQTLPVALEPEIPPVPVPEPEPSTPPVEAVMEAAEPPAILPELVDIPAEPVMQANPVPQPTFIQRFLQANPDLEKFIGENLMNKIGIAILVLGIGYFVKFAIDQQWINEVGRVFIGILAGGALIGLAHRLRQTVPAFSSVLVGGGLAVLYFTIAIAFHEYALFSQTVAFGLMVVITAFSILLSVAYNRVELAVVSLVGGFATPFMVSTGAGDYRILLTYILILDVGMLVLSYIRKWNLVHIVAYAFTLLLYGSWLGTAVVGETNAPYLGAFIYGTAYYGIFMAMNISYNLRYKATFSVLEIILLLSNTFSYYTAGMLILANIGKGLYQGLFTVALGVVNLVLAYSLYRRGGVDRNLIYLLIGLVITFVSLAIPVQLEGNFITMFWALEAVLLLWFAQKSGLRLVASASVIVLGLMLISLSMDWSALYGTATNPPLPILLNKAFVTSVISLIGLVATRWLLNTQDAPFSFWTGQLAVGTYRRIISYLTGGAMYLAGSLELNYQLITAVGFGPNRTIVMGSYNLLFIMGLLVLAQRNGQRNNLMRAAGLGLLGIVAYLVAFNPAVMVLLNNYFLYTETSFLGFPVHYGSVVLTMGIVAWLVRNRSRLEPLPPRVLQLWPWFAGFVVLYLASSELFTHVIVFNLSDADKAAAASSPAQQLVVINRFDNLLTQTNKVGLPILWGICAFLFMWVGLNRKIRPLRIMSLSLFALTLLKLFLYDLQGISEGGRIAAFLSLGVLLLTISFMYQKIRKLIMADDANPPLVQSE
ncbi:DUF2339 domain-containing protein [Nibrella saemangeumensis]|uniref:DUF2339 domain-containing protein n=1 Tax=Nibrella saemangeumensis TaxID=1084526 RepID=A0ABP8MSL1_9BACT